MSVSSPLIDFKQIPWPASILCQEFDEFLDRIEVVMKFKPGDVDDGITIDDTQVNNQNSELQLLLKHNEINKKMTKCEVVKEYISAQQLKITVGLTEASIVGFEQYPKYRQLASMAKEKLQPFLKEGFQPNRGYGDFKRPRQLERLKHTIAQHIRKLQDKNRCLVIREETLLGMDGLHVSALHIAFKEADKKGRPCTDTNQSGLNDGTDMVQLTEFLGDFKLPQLRALARMVLRAEERGHQLLHKTDVTSAFNCMFLSPEAALILTFLIGDYIIIPLVAGFGWCAAPAYYNVIADCIHWAHNGGVSRQVLDEWMIQSDEEVSQEVLKAHDHTQRSITYVDDSCGHPLCRWELTWQI